MRGSEGMDNKIENVAIILNYNDWMLTKKTALLHIANNVFDLVVIVDNNSTDNSYEKLVEISSDNIHVIKTNKNGGYSYGNNQGIKYVIEKFNARFITIMNPDVVVKKKSIAKCLNVLKKNQNIGATAPIMKDSDGKISESFAWRHLDFFQECITLFSIPRKLFKVDIGSRYDINDFVKQYHMVDVVPGSLIVFNSKALLDAGMFDENVFLFVEERIISKRLHSHNYEIAICNDAYFIHYHSVTIKKVLSEYKRFKILLDSRYYFVKTYTDLSIIQDIVFKIVCQLAKIEKLFIYPFKGFYNSVKYKK